MWSPGKYGIAAFALAIFLSLLNRACCDDVDTTGWSSKTVTHFTLKGNGISQISGRTLAVDRDAGCLLQTARGELKLILWKDVKTAHNTASEFKAQTKRELETELTAADPATKVLTSDHYIVLYRGSSAYAKWIVSLYERLYDSFYSYWKNIGIELHEPEFPLIVNVFDDKQGFIDQGKRDNLDAVSAMIGYYHMHTNQTVSYDLTESQSNAAPGQIIGRETLVSLIRSKPGWERTVATVVHESVHQLAYNSGLQVRLADNPLWLSEGIAMYFEAPDLSSPRGWKGIGKPNLYQFSALRRLSPDLTSNDWITPLIEDDALFTDGNTVNMAYAQSWALTYYLLKFKSKEFANYMKAIGQGTPLAPTDPKKRLDMFHEHFGDNMLGIQSELAKKLSRL